MAQGIIIRTNGTIENVVINDLHDMQAAVGGYIERACSFDGSDMWVNEEGLLRGLPINTTAAIVRQTFCNVAMSAALVGDALILGFTEDGEKADVTDAARERVESIALFHDA